MHHSDNAGANLTLQIIDLKLLSNPHGQKESFYGAIYDASLVQKLFLFEQMSSKKKHTFEALYRVSFFILNCKF